MNNSNFIIILFAFSIVILSSTAILFILEVINTEYQLSSIFYTLGITGSFIISAITIRIIQNADKSLEDAV